MARQATLQHAKLQAMAMARTKWFHQEEMGGNPNEIQFFLPQSTKRWSLTNYKHWSMFVDLHAIILAQRSRISGTHHVTTSSSRHFQTSWVLGKNIIHLFGSCHVSCLLLMLAWTTTTKWGLATSLLTTGCGGVAQELWIVTRCGRFWSLRIKFWG